LFDSENISFDAGLVTVVLISP